MFRPLQHHLIDEKLETSQIGRDIYYLESVDSTNEYAKTGLDQHGQVVLAEEQLAGKGRLGRKWHAPKYSSILMSVVLVPHTTGIGLQLLTLATGVAVSEAIQDNTGLPARLKWPNDVEIYERKVCGILTESQFQGDNLSKLIVGIGCNVSQLPGDFPDNLRRPATSLLIDTNQGVPREALIASLLNFLERWYQQLVAGETDRILLEWKRRSHQIGAKVQFSRNGRQIEGEFDDLANDGAAIVMSNGTPYKVRSGELT